MMHHLYLLIDFCTILIPFLFSFHPKLRFYEHFGSFFLACLLVGCVFVAWDAQFTVKGIWGFNPNYLMGIYMFQLPIEELLFFLCVPFACVFTYHSLTLYVDLTMSEKQEKATTVFLCVLLGGAAIYYHNKLYTIITFSALIVVLLYLSFIAAAEWLGPMYKIYVVLLVPFLLVNGLLTGTGLEAPIVWYNNHEIIGLRILSIPVEDTFYGFLLILLNVYFFERFKLLSTFITL